MKFVILLCLITLIYTQSVQNKNQCNACTQLHSQSDCTQNTKVPGCEWAEATTTPAAAAKCQLKTTTPNTFKEYCLTLTTPETTCAKTTGCAFVDASCTHFAGCSAYVKTTTSDCQAISYECMSDGVSCIEAKECSGYKTQPACETTPSISGILKCIWNSTAGICRDYTCSEADSALTTDKQCKAWLAGCVTRGKGCWSSPLPTCATYTGDDASCSAYIGSDGNCELATGSTQCKAKECVKAAVTISSDDDCKAYQIGCITTGKGCIQATTKPLCASYSGDTTSCVGYLGSDGVCEGDAGGSKCRSRKCENGIFTTDDDCEKYRSGCKTNGKACVTTLGACSTYSGTVTTCNGYIGSDGYCKGTSTTAAACTAKVCEEAPDTNTTDVACGKYQVGCKSTGKGCAKTLASCTSYEGDANSCLPRIGSEGKCTYASGTKCIPRTCASALASVNTNPSCADWFTNCVTTGAGCVQKTTCDATVKESSCIGTDNCSWQPICTSNASCSLFKTSAICAANRARVWVEDKKHFLADGSTLDPAIKPNPEPIYKSVRCAWSGSSCVDMTCTHLTGKQYDNDQACQTELPDCISNRTNGCIAKTDCSKLQGDKNTCESYPGYCTNTSLAINSTACIARQCTDKTDGKDLAACNGWLPQCITNGTKCVDYTTTCTAFQGDQATCEALYGYVSGAYDKSGYVTQKCYNISGAQVTASCLVKTCTQAKGKLNDGECQLFLDGCVYDGGDSCLNYNDSSIKCTDYKNGASGDYCDKVKILQFKDTDKYCYGSGVSASCKIRACTDKTSVTANKDCEEFKSGCIMKSSNSCEEYTNVTCESQSGTASQQCSEYFGYVGTNSKTKVKCTKLDLCKDRICTDKTNPTKQSDCTEYKSTCRFYKTGPAETCIDEGTCTSYQLPDTLTSDPTKFSYCTTITDNSGNLCGYKTGDTKCSNRTCEQVSVTDSSICITYVTQSDGNQPCKLSSSGNYCYNPDTSCASSIPGTVISASSQLAYCNSIKNTKSNFCSWTSGTNCRDQNACELQIIQTSAQICNDNIVTSTALGRICQHASGKCYTTNVGNQTNCTGYKAEGANVPAQKTFCSSFYTIDDTAKFGKGTGVYQKCTYVSGNNCSLPTACDQILSPTSQSDCNVIANKKCFYFSGSCLAITATTCVYTFGSAESSFAGKDKVKYCLNLQDTTYCQLNAAQTACEANVDTDCTSYTTIPTTGNWNGVSITPTAFCHDHSNKTKTIHCKAVSNSATACSAGTCDDILNPISQYDCDTYQLECIYSENKCLTKSVINGPAAAGDCAITTKVAWTTYSSATTAQKIAYCQQVSFGSTTIFCTYDSNTSPAAAVCAGANACSTYTIPSANSSAQLAFCNSKVNASGVKCSWTSGSNCREWDCFDISSPKSQVDCDLGGPGKTCTYYAGTCFNNKAADCNTIPGHGSDFKAYCDALTVTPSGGSATKCTYITGDTTCTNSLTDCAYSVTSNQKSTCEKLTSSGGTDCVYLTGNACTQKAQCTSYSTTDDTLCRSIVDFNDRPCKFSTGTACESQVCTDYLNLTECKKGYNCLYYANKCIDKKSSCSAYTPEGTGATAQENWCKGVTTLYQEDLCKWDGTSDCADRTCDDVAYYTDYDCNAYLEGCKTNGTKCVAGNTTCGTISGDDKFCNALTDATGKDKCKPTSPATTTGACSARTCYDNVSANDDPACETFMSGCVTRQPGCIPNTVKCDSYRGTKDTCETFKQLTSTDSQGVPQYTYCSGDTANVSTSPCKDRTCSDNTIATDDGSCDRYKKDCVTNGAGCIEKTSACTAYNGDQAGCSKFMGSSGADYCWNLSTVLATAPTACAKKKCTDINGKNNKECLAGMKPIKDAKGVDGPILCVFDGDKNCTDNNKTCSQFQGTEETCATYTASNGPCKATTVGTIVGSCTPRICTEAPNTLITDADCKKYHPSCYTTGYGCTTTNDCKFLTNSASCSSRPECAWSNQCKSVTNNCGTYTGTSQSQCVNSKVNGFNCAWTENGSICRDQTCADQPATINKHSDCQAFSNTCTTNGAGCVTIGACQTYKSKSVCEAASTSKDEVNRCGWENNVCRDRTCGDKQGVSDEECNRHLAGCKTNGSTCVTGNSCSDFTANQSYCLKSNVSACLWVNSVCYDYERCEDAPFTTHVSCQKFSPLCTTNGTLCIPITSCATTTLKVSCIVGTDGKCGWLPIGGGNTVEKCQKFGACTDAVGGTNDICQAYGPDCLSDGTKCIAKANCSGYATAISCGNTGLDGICFWNATSNICKLKDCGDSVANNTTNDGCRSFSVASGSCTTDGTKCIPLSTCTSYVEAGCYTGTDGECTFAVPVGTAAGSTSAVKSCRQKQCEDIQGGTANGSCQGAINGKKCVSNGVSCIPKAACTTYTSKSACNGGGVDSTGASVTCTFTVTAATAPNVGTCKQFTSCSDANNDKDACMTKTGVCLWSTSTTGGATTTSCKSQACDTYAVGTDCQPVPNFDYTGYTVCVLQNGKCAAADPGTMTDAKICYAKSAYTYSWNTATSKCESCIAGSTSSNGTNNGTNNGQTNGTTNGTTTDSGYILGIMIPLGLLGFMA